MSVHRHRSLPETAAYARLRSASRADIAWEWLRRDPVYRRLAPSPITQTDCGSLVERGPSWCENSWGCLSIADVEWAAGQSILWSGTVMPAVLFAEARSARDGDIAAFDLRRWARHATLIADADEVEHLMLHGDGRTLRIDIFAGSLRSGPVNLRYLFDKSDTNHERAIATLRSLLLLRRTDGFTALPVDPPAPRRSVDALRVHDASIEGASIRDVGKLLFGAARVGSEWHAAGEALKSQCRRWIAYAQFMAAGGFKTLLR